MECHFLRQACDIPSTPKSLGHVTCFLSPYVCSGQPSLRKCSPASGKHHLWPWTWRGYGEWHHLLGLLVSGQSHQTRVLTVESPVESWVGFQSFLGVEASENVHRSTIYEAGKAELLIEVEVSPSLCLKCGQWLIPSILWCLLLLFSVSWPLCLPFFHLNTICLKCRASKGLMWITVIHLLTH